jgi:hypothetical protein
MLTLTKPHQPGRATMEPRSSSPTHLETNGHHDLAYHHQLKQTDETATELRLPTSLSTPFVSGLPQDSMRVLITQKNPTLQHLQTDHLHLKSLELCQGRNNIFIPAPNRHQPCSNYRTKLCIPFTVDHLGRLGYLATNLLGCLCLPPTH